MTASPLGSASGDPRGELEDGPTLHPADRLIDAIEAVGAPACVGLDPVLDRLPRTLAPEAAPVERIEAFSEAVLEAIAGRVPAVKPQSACFERYGAEGVAVLARIVERARRLGLVVVLDAKRGDIGISASHYAAASAGLGADWTTVNGYFGPEGFDPFRGGRGAFVLVRTSNRDSGRLQSLRLEDGRSVAEAMAEIVADAGDSSIGRHGYSDLGAVVGATHPEDAARLRKAMPRQILLVPGFGAQGGRVEDIRALVAPDGRGVLVTASRSVIYAFRPDAPEWTEQVGHAAEELRSTLAGVVGIPSGRAGR